MLQATKLQVGIAGLLIGLPLGLPPPPCFAAPSPATPLLFRLTKGTAATEGKNGKFFFTVISTHS